MFSGGLVYVDFIVQEKNTSDLFILYFSVMYAIRV